ncbi:glycoside hydrolase family 3 N-terminal domain-containing protein [Krasilnikoviella flava]|uniref:Beta-N-acetylhexosaminidase n=1 Tax=Krasilnikoviella flava TaxID=526729 RepID=A0A1T5KR46_9MICO|nr:glycoside hydrolase family 3 N-terminal domain-containing protein [Krasilnikoviella flava]SKC65748.1 beta-N-acetylhexosaminidase [Krasilnikoviella flava]
MTATDPVTGNGIDTDADADAVRRAVLGVLLPGFTGTTPPGWLLDAARSGLGGVVLFAHNTPDLATTAALTAHLHAAAPALLVATDEEGGDVSRLEAAAGSSLPGAAALGAVDDERLTGAAGEALGRLLAAAGVDLDLAPVLDVDSPGNPVIGVRAFGPDPDAVARHGVAFARGLQRGGVGTCAKHFPGHGSTTVDSHLALPVVDADLEALRGRDLVPFAAAFAGDARSGDARSGDARSGETGSDGGPAADALMTAHVVVPALGPAPASLEPAVETLARQLGHAGPIVTDALDMRAVSDGADVGEAAVRAVEGGADLLCLGTTTGRDDESLFRSAVDALVAAVGTGRVDLDRLAASRRRTDALVRRLHDRRSAVGATTGAVPAEHAREALAAVGAEVARRAVRVVGPAPVLAGAPDVVDLRLRLDHAAGRTAQHVQRAVADRWAGAVLHPGREHPVLDDAAFAALLRGLAGGADGAVRPLVVVTREPAPGGAEHARLAELQSARPDLVVVHTGVPDAGERWLAALPGGLPTTVLACGTGRANAEAAVALLAGHVGTGRVGTGHDTEVWR